MMLPTDAAMTTRRSSLPETLIAAISFPPLFYWLRFSLRGPSRYPPVFRTSVMIVLSPRCIKGHFGCSHRNLRLVFWRREASKGAVGSRHCELLSTHHAGHPSCPAQGRSGFTLGDRPVGGPYIRPASGVSRHFSD